MSGLFDQEDSSFLPLASRLRPEKPEDYVGQQHLFGPGKPLRRALEGGHLHSCILWGPPGTGKTTLARLFSRRLNVHFISVSAILGGVAEIRQAVSEARNVRAMQGVSSLVFVDEVHRFNKAQQDGFLPFIEDGTFIFIGATTENPSFHLNSALLSRTRVYRLNPLTVEDLEVLLNRAEITLNEAQGTKIRLDDEARAYLLKQSSGDARRLLNMLEVIFQTAQADLSGVPGDGESERVLGSAQIADLFSVNPKQFDKHGDRFYDQISALHKSVRGSDPDAALYWFCRMVEAGCEPLYIGRRLVRMASEDIGNADPRALHLAMTACEAYERLGSPEGELALAQAVLYLACCAKSNAVYTAYKDCMRLIEETPDHDVPMHLRNAPTQLMKDEGMGKGYRYAHDEPNAFAAGEVYFPEALAGIRFYQPVDRGLESQIRAKLEQLRRLNETSTQRRQV